MNTHPVVLRRLLGSLVRNGLVRPVRGARGGFLLARPAPKIKLSEVYRCVEKNHALGLPRRRPNKTCPVGCNIPPVLSRVAAAAEQALQRELARVSVADVYRQTARRKS